MPSFSVVYDHQAAAPHHSLAGASEALRMIFPDAMPRSILDVGCGTGTWLRAARDRGSDDLLGVDGAELPQEQLHVSKAQVRREDLNRPLDLGRRFDLILCLETVEHLEPASAATVIDTLTRHGDCILFSAAAPGQSGTHHVNCRWPDFWQELFNERGFACDDGPRWAIWDNPNIEPWYRQNLFMAKRDERAGREPRIKPVVHPAMLEPWSFLDLEEIASGGLSWKWYAQLPFRAAAGKLRRRLGRRAR